MEKKKSHQEEWSEGKKVGFKIHIARKEVGANQEEFAKTIGVARVTLARYESGVIMPDVGTLQSIARSSKKPITFFFDEVPVTTNEDLYKQVASLKQQLVEIKEEISKYKK